MPELRYHQAVFDFLREKPILSPQRKDLIAERERVCGVRFPAAVNEWMGIEGVETLFHKRTNNDYLPLLEDLGQPRHAQQGYLCVAHENQAVLLWYVRLDEGDNPPVYHDDGATVGVAEPRLPEIAWKRVSGTYSEFIYNMIDRDRWNKTHTGYDQWGTITLSACFETEEITLMKKCLEAAISGHFFDAEILRACTSWPQEEYRKLLEDFDELTHLGHNTYQMIFDAVELLATYPIDAPEPLESFLGIKYLHLQWFQDRLSPLYHEWGRHAPQYTNAVERLSF